MRVVVISGYFNPVHTGHIDYIKGAAALGDKLVVIVNNDAQVSLKGSTPFMSEYERVEIVSSIKGVTQAVMSIDTDETVVKTIESIHNECKVDYFFDSMLFCNGGDRTRGNSPEEQYCKKSGISTAYNVGGTKTQSSSSLISKITLDKQ
jgi:cytidyltransferase-like protein